MRGDLVFETLAEFNVYSNVGTTEDLESAWGFYLYSATLYDHEHVLSEKPEGVDPYTCQYYCTVEGCDYTETQEHIWDGDWAYLDASGHAKTCTACGYSEEKDYVPTIDHDIYTVVTDPTCEEEGYTFCKISDIYEDESMMALGQFEYKAVALHPSDKGMRAIAERIVDVVE